MAFLCIASSAACEPPPVKEDPAPPAAKKIPEWTYDVVKSYPHDRLSYTQGLLWHEGKLLESAGRTGISDVRRVELTTGKVLQKTALGKQYFAEGLALLNGKLWQLTWQENTCFTYDPATLKQNGAHKYEGEGWGLTTDGKSLIMSDGTNKIKFISPVNFKVERTVEVFNNNDPNDVAYNLNELEFVEGEIFANVWQTDVVYRISPKDGKVLGVIDLGGIHPPESDPAAVLNGIAYDPATKRLWVTGKLWTKLYEVKLKRRN